MTVLTFVILVVPIITSVMTHVEKINTASIIMSMNILGSTGFSEFGSACHNHRFAGVTGPAILSGRSHVHEFFNRTDTTDAHHHNMRQFTGPAIFLENGRHIHFAEGSTTFDDGHLHRYNFTTLIDDPTR